MAADKGKLSHEELEDLLRQDGAQFQAEVAKFDQTGLMARIAADLGIDPVLHKAAMDAKKINDRKDPPKEGR
jgi:hypothetical protein